jgi:hypothetical protein
VTTEGFLCPTAPLANEGVVKAQCARLFGAAINAPGCCSGALTRRSEDKDDYYFHGSALKLTAELMNDEYKDKQWKSRFMSGSIAI